MLAARTALYRIALSPRRLPSVQTLYLSISIPNDGGVVVSKTKTKAQSDAVDVAVKKEKEALAACGDVDNDDDEMEQEEMWVDADPSLSTEKREWGGPTRGGRLPEPTRYGDWERKGRCSDF